MQVSMDSLARTVKQSSITEKRKAGRWSSYVACVVNHTQEVYNVTSYQEYQGEHDTVEPGEVFRVLIDVDRKIQVNEVSLQVC